MTLTVDLQPEIGDRLAERAADQGVSLSDFVNGLLKAYVPDQPSESMTPKEIADAWRASARNLPVTPLLSDEAISRESIYGQDA